MLEPILKGLVQWLYEMMVDIMAYASGELLGVMSMDLSYFEKTAPVISDIVDVFIILGWALLMGNMIFQLTKSIVSGIGFEGEDPKMIFFRTFVFSFLLLVSRQVCEIGLSITGTVIDMLKLPDSITVTVPDESMFSLGAGAKWLLVIIVGVILMVQMVKLLFEIGERYVIMSVLTFFAPLAFSMGGSRNTNDIFKGWCRMYGSMMVMMIMNIVFLKLIMSAMAQMASGGVLIWLVFVVALTRVARKIDSHIGKIGLNPAQTGDAISGRFPGAVTMMAVRVMTSAVGKSLAANKSTGGSRSKSGGWRHSSGGAHGGNGRPFAGNRYAGNPAGSSSHTSSSTSSSSTNHAGSSQNANSSYTSGSQSNTSAYTSSSHSSQSQKGTVQNQNTAAMGSQGKTTENTVYGVNGNGISGQAQRDSVRMQNPITNPLVRAAGETQNFSSQTGTAEQHSNPPLSRTTGRGNAQIPKPGVFGPPKPGTIPADNNIEHMANMKNTVSGASPQFRVGRGINGSTVVQGESTAHVTQDGKRLSGDGTTTINSRTTDVKKNIGQTGGMINVHQQSGVSLNSGSSHETVQSSEKQSVVHTESNSGRQSTVLNQRQDIETHGVASTEKRVNHAYKHGRYNPSAENRKTKQSYYQRQNNSGIENRRENRRNRRVGNRGEDYGTRKRKK